MAKQAGPTSIIPARVLSDQETKLVDCYANPAHKETYRKRKESLEAAGYSPGTIRSKSAEMFRRPHLVEAINAVALRHANTSDFGEDSVAQIRQLLRNAIDFNILDCFETVTWTEIDAAGKQVTRRALQVRNLVEAGIDGRLIESIKQTWTQKGASIEFKPIAKTPAARLLATMEGALDEGAAKGGDRYLVVQYLGNPINPKDVNNFAAFRDKFLSRG